MLGYQEDHIGDRPEEWFEPDPDADRERVKEEIAVHQKGRLLISRVSNACCIRCSFRWMLSAGSPSMTLLEMFCAWPITDDITEGKVSDPLTGLPNRLLFIDRVGRLIKHTKRRKDQLLRFYFLDLTEFKMINDSMGHLIGDQLLLGVARSVGEVFAVNGYRRASRRTSRRAPRGDEFTVPARDIKDLSDAKRARTV